MKWGRGLLQGSGGIRPQVLVLGGSGKFGSLAARRLASFDVVSEVGVAGRNSEALGRASVDIGEKAHPVEVDILDEGRLAGIAADYDIVVNAAGPEWEALLPGLRGAIAGGTNYCDLGAHGPTAQRQLELDARAKDRSVTALIGMGLDPGLSNLLAVHASRQLDRVDDVRCCYAWGLRWALADALEILRTTGRADVSWQLFPHIACGPVRAFRDGRPVDIEPLENPVEVVRPGVGPVKAYPVAMPEPITLPRYLPGVRNVSSLLSFFPPHLNELVFSAGQRVSRGGLSVADATKSIITTVAEDPDHWFTVPGQPVPDGAFMWIVATGWKDGRGARYTCWPVRLPYSTGLTLALGALRILRGEVDAKGVLPPEALFEPTPFLEEVGAYAKEEDRGKPLLGESLDWLP